MARSSFAGKAAAALAAVFVVQSAGCARVQEVSPVRIPFVDAKPESTVSPDLSAEPPRSVAVLPFSSIVPADVRKADGRAILRKNFNSYFQALPFACKDAKETDEILSRIGLTDIRDINKAGAAKLGAALGVDAVVYGNITSAINFTGGVYSLTELNGTLTMADARTGEVLWKVKHFEKSIGGLITESDQLLTAIESQIENAKASLAYQRCADDFSRKVMKTLPKFKAGAGALPNIERVVVRPEGKKLFVLFDAVEIEMAGDRGLPAWFDIGTLRENVPMAEVQPGIYRGVYTVGRGDCARDVPIVAKLGVAELNRQRIAAGADGVSIEAAPPGRPRSPKGSALPGKGVTLSWDPPEEGAAAAYEIYRANGRTFRYQLVGKVEALSFTDDRAPVTADPAGVLYQVIAVDRFGNKSDPADPVKVAIQ